MKNKEEPWPIYTRVREHFHAGLDFQNKSARFLENHDEPRAAAIFPPEVHEAAAVITFLSPGLRFFGGGRLQLFLKTKTMGWDMANISGIFPADAYKIHGFAVLNRTPGLGLPLVVRTKKTKESPYGGALPITAFLPELLEFRQKPPPLN